MIVLCAALGTAGEVEASAAPSGPGEAGRPGRTAATFVDRGIVHLVEDLGPAEGPRKAGLRAVRVWREDGRAYDAAVGDEAIVQLVEGADPKVSLAVFGLEGTELSPGARLWKVRAKDAAFFERRDPGGVAIAARLARADAAAHFAMAVPNFSLEHQFATQVPPDDPRYGGQWYLQRVDIAGAWAHSTGSSTTTVVVIDSGCDLAHPDLMAKLDPGLDVIDDDNDPSYDPTEHGGEHGTACAGIVGATTDNGLGIAGACPDCRIRCVRLVGGAVPIDADVRAFQFAKEVNAAVISNSWSFSDGTPVPGPLAAAMRDVMDNGRGGRGTVVVFAAGNENRELGRSEVQAVRDVIAVGALTVFDEASSFSNHGAAVDLTSPMGTLTLDISGPGGADPTDYTNNFGGTSSACPVVSGIAGLLAAAKPDATAREIEHILLTTTRPAPYATPDAMGHDPLYGFGIVDAAHSMRVLLGLPEPTPDAGVPPDTGTAEDAASVDAGLVDSGLVDSGLADAGVADATQVADAAMPAAAKDDGGCAATHVPGRACAATVGLWLAALALFASRLEKRS